MRPLPLLVLLAASPALAQGGAPLQTIAPGTTLECRLDGAPTGRRLAILGIGVYADENGRRGGFVWDNRGFAFVSGPHAGTEASAAGQSIRLAPPELAGRELVCAP